MESIIKYDTSTTPHTITTWTTQAHTPGEPLFIPNPEGTEEDDGILLCVVLDGRKKKSYMLALDARNMKEVARAEMEGVMSFGFHGKHVAGGMDGILGKEGKAPVQQPGVPEW